MSKHVAPLITNGSVLTVHMTTSEFEKLAKSYVKKEIEKSPLPVAIYMKDTLEIQSEIAVFTATIPMTMHFKPIVTEEGNIRLKHTKMNVGALKIPPETTLKLMQKSVHFPSWIAVRPKQQEMFIDLSLIQFVKDARVKAKKFDLANDRIEFEVIVPTK